MAPSRAGIPRAFVLALMAVIALELGLRLLVPSDEFPVRQDMRESAALLRTLQAAGAAEVSFVGASLTQRGVVLPRVSALLDAKTGRQVHIANYGHPDAQAEFVEDLVHALMKRNPPPRVILYGVSPMQLNRDLVPERTAHLWRASDLPREWQQHGRSMLRDLPQVIHNELKLQLRLLQLRHDRTAWTQRILHGRPFPKTPLRGGHYHLTPGSRLTLAERPPTRDTRGYLNMKRRIQESIVAGRWVHSEPLLEHMKEIGRLCRDHGTELVYFEIPFHRTLGDLLAPNTYATFYTLMGEVSRETGYPFVPFSELGPVLTDDHYSDGAHLNLEGARVMTGPVTRRLIMPAMKRRFEQDRQVPSR